jgi:hypothetical protein
MDLLEVVVPAHHLVVMVVLLELYVLPHLFLIHIHLEVEFQEILAPPERKDLLLMVVLVIQGDQVLLVIPETLLLETQEIPEQQEILVPVLVH